MVSTPDIGSRSEIGVAPGLYTVPVSGLEYSTNYTWTVSVTDGEHPIVREFTFATEIDDPIISNEDPGNGAQNVAFDPVLQADILDHQSESVDWEISLFVNDAWQLLNSGTLPSGAGMASTTAYGVDEFGTRYTWRVRRPGDGQRTLA